MHASRGQAVMCRLYDDTNTLRLEDLLDRVGDLSGHLLLDL